MVLVCFFAYQSSANDLRVVMAEASQKWEQAIQDLIELDQVLMRNLADESPDSEQIGELVGKREQILLLLLADIEQNHNLQQSLEWREAIERTTAIVEIMQGQTSQLRLAMSKMRRGQTSIQQYQKFV